MLLVYLLFPLEDFLVSFFAYCRLYHSLPFRKEICRQDRSHGGKRSSEIDCNPQGMLMARSTIGHAVDDTRMENVPAEGKQMACRK